MFSSLPSGDGLGEQANPAAGSAAGGFLWISRHSVWVRILFWALLFLLLASGTVALFMDRSPVAEWRLEKWWILSATGLALLFCGSIIYCIGLLVRQSVLEDEEKRTRDIRLLGRVVDQTSESIVVTDLEGNIQYMNQVARAMMREDDPADGDSVRNVESFSREDEKIKQQEIVRKTREAGFWNGEVDVVGKRGLLHILECNTWLVRDESEQPYAMCGISKDITASVLQRKLAEGIISLNNDIWESLDAQRKAALAMLMQSTASPWGALLFSRQTEAPPVFAVWSSADRGSHATSFDEDDPSAASWIEESLRQPAGPVTEGLPVSLTRALSLEGHDLLQVPVTSSPGHQMMILLGDMPYQPSPGLLGHLQRVGERVLTLLERSEAAWINRRLQAVVEQSRDSVVLTDTEGRIVYVNPMFETVTGYSRKEALGQNPRFLKSGQQDESVYRDLWEHISSGKVWRGRLENRAKNGETFKEDATIFPITGKEGQIEFYAGVKQNVTQLESVQNQLYQAQKMEAVGQIAGGVAHDFNNILQVIQSYGQLLLEDLSTGTDAFEKATEMVQASERAAALTRQLLVFSRKEASSPECVDLNETIRALSTMIPRMIGEHIQVYIREGGASARIYIDPVQLEQVILNLAINARDAMPDGGELRLAVHRHTALVGRQGSWISLTIQDTGCGIPQDIQAQIFDPFYTTKEEGKGTGLGLSIIYRIIKNANGWVDVESTPGEGATFRVVLPEWSDSAGSESEAESMAQEVSGNGQTILFAEDDKTIRKLTGRLLESGGYRVLAAEDGKRALELFEAHAEDIDFLLLDVIMPGMKGLEIYRAIHERNPALPVLFISGYAGQSEEQREFARLKLKLIQKPFNGPELLQAIAEQIEASSQHPNHAEPQGSVADGS